MTFLLPKDLGNTCSETMNTRGTKQSKNVHAKPSSFPSNEQYKSRGFFFFNMLIKWLYLFWAFPGLSVAVTDLFHKLIYFCHGICRDLCFHSCWLFLLLLLSLFSPSEKSLSGTFESGENCERSLVLQSPHSHSQLLTFQLEMVFALNMHTYFSGVR